MTPPLEVELRQLMNQMIFIWSDFTYYPEEFYPAFAQVTGVETDLIKFQQRMRGMDFTPLLHRSHKLVCRLLYDEKAEIASFYLLQIPLTARQSTLEAATVRMVQTKARAFLWDYHFQGRATSTEQSELYLRALADLQRAKSAS